MEAQALEKTDQLLQLVSLSDPAIDHEALTPEVVASWLSSLDMKVLPLTKGKPRVYEARALSRVETDNILLAAFAKKWPTLDKEEATDASLAWADARAFDVAVCCHEPPSVLVRRELGGLVWRYSTLRPMSPAQQ